MATDQEPTRRWSSWVERLVGLAILLGTGWLLWERRERFAELLDASWLDITAMSVLVLSAWLLSSAQSWLLFRAEGAPIGFWENFVLAAAGTFANYLPMRVGTLLRGRYMKQVHGLRYARFGSVFGIRTVLLVSASGFLGALGTLGLWVFEGRPAWLLLVGFVAMAIGALVALLVGLPKFPKSEGRLSRIWNDFADGFATARSRPRLSAAVLLLTLLQQVALGLRLYVGFDAFQAEASPWLMVVLAPMVLLVSFVAFTPGGLGLREAAMGYVTYATGYDFSLGLFAGSLDRAVLMALTLLIGTPSFVYIWRRLSSGARYDGSPTDSRTGSRSRASLR